MIALIGRGVTGFKQKVFHTGFKVTDGFERFNYLIND